MPTITTKDGTEIYYKDWGKGQPIVFSHGWPLSADDWDTQMLFFGQRGYRVIAHDRRGHGRSSQTWDGHDMDHYADDLAALIEALGLEWPIVLGHSMGARIAAALAVYHRGAAGAVILADPPLTGPGRDPYPGIVTGAAMAGARVALTVWQEQRPQRSLPALLDEVFEQLAAGLAPPSRRAR